MSFVSNTRTPGCPKTLYEKPLTTNVSGIGTAFYFDIMRRKKFRKIVKEKAVKAASQKKQQTSESSAVREVA